MDESPLEPSHTENIPTEVLNPSELTNSAKSKSELLETENAATKPLPENSDRGQLSAEEVVAKAIAPVKKEFLRPPPSSRSAISDTNKDENGKSESTKKSGIVKEKKSKRQLKRERREVCFCSTLFFQLLNFNYVKFINL